MPTLLLELFSEEIPARMQGPAAEQLQQKIVSGCQALGYALDESGVETFVSPRHFAIRVKSLPAKQADVKAERKGPRANAPRAALDGFLRSTGLTLDQLELRGDTYFANVETKGRDTREALVPMLNEILVNFAWPKSMRWGAGTKTWVRPLHSIVALLDGEVLPVAWEHLQAGNTTLGHRFLSPKPITIAHPDEYEANLKAADVWVQAEARRAHIIEKLRAKAAELKLTLKEDEGLLREVTGLVEFPAVLAGRIDADYMHLPPEVLISEMKEHQRYFALLHADGSLADRFLITTNMDPARMEDGGAAIIAGNERVLRARLADGKFFWEQDQKIRLEDWGHKLDSMVFHAKLGSMQARVERLTKLATFLAPKLGADHVLVERAAHLAKADLTSGMVGEFPELQGVMGRYYAMAQGEPNEVAEAIAAHYKPLGPSDSLPEGAVSLSLALADKLDVLAGMYAVGEKPTGSKDPFALRRMALGILRIILTQQLSLPLEPVLAKAVKLAYDAAAKSERESLAKRAQKQNAKSENAHALNVDVIETDFSTARAKETEAELLAFLQDRLKVSLKDEGIRHDVVDAVLTEDADDLLDIANRARALNAMLATTDGENLLAGTKRAMNILRAEEKKDKRTYDAHAKAKLFAIPQENVLFDGLTAVEKQIDPLLDARDYAGAMKLLASLRAPVDAFFEAVLVNDPDANIRLNRLALLSQLRSQMQRIADFDALQG